MTIKIESHAEQILEKFNVDSAPIPVEKIAVWLDLQVVPTDLGPGVSGALVIKGGEATIGVNPSESRVRRRFTVAHELGHYILHKTKNELFVDKQMFLGNQVLFRDEESSSGEKRKEREANAFAAALLMPKSIIKREIDKIIDDKEIDSEEELVTYLAKKFDVSELAMTYRMTN